MRVKGEVLAFRWFVNPDNQVETVELVEDREHPDGVLAVEVHKSISPGSSHRPFGTTIRLPDELVPVRIQPTGDIILPEASLDATNTVIDQWEDFSLL